MKKLFNQPNLTIIVLSVMLVPALSVRAQSLVFGGYTEGVFQTVSSVTVGSGSAANQEWPWPSPFIRIGEGEPQEPSYDNLTFSSDDETKATVDENGNVTILAYEGSVTITAAYNGVINVDNEDIAVNTSGSYTITIVDERAEPGEGLFSFEASSASATYGDASVSTPALNSGQLGTAAAPSVTFSSSDESVATVDASSGAVTITGVGSTAISAYFGGNSEYKPATVSYTLTVSKKPVTVDGITASDKVYDGTTTATLSGGTVSGLVGNDVVTVAATGAFADANVGPDKTVTISNISLSGAAASNYELAASNSQPSLTASITALEASLSWSNTSFTYDGQTHAPTATVSNLVSGDACTVTVTGEASAVGTHTATATALSNSNYSLPASATQSFTITAATMTGVSATGFTGTYDDAAHGISVTAPQGATVSYGTAEGNYGLDASPTYTNAGTYTVYYQVSMEGYDTVTGSAVVLISKADGLVSFGISAVSATMGESFTSPTASTAPYDLDITYSSSNTGVATVDASTGEVTLVGPGTTTITASFSGDDNYYSDSDSYTLTVSAPETALEPIEKERVYEISPSDFVNADGSEKELSNSVINNFLYTLKNQNAPDGDGYDPDEQAIVLNTEQSLAGASAIFSQGLVPGSGEYAGRFTGISFIVPAGEGYIHVESQEANERSLIVQIGSAEIHRIYNTQRHDMVFPYRSDVETLALLYNGGVFDGGRLDPTRSVMKGKKTVGDVKVFKVTYKASAAPTAIETVGFDDEADDCWYDLNGQRIAKPARAGVYIRNGQKVVVR